VKVSPEGHRRHQKAAIFVALLLFAMVLLLLQLWLFVGVLESMLDGRYTMALPAAGFSIALFGVNFWMLRGIYAMEKRS